MPIGAFLDSMPSALFVTAHVLFLFVGLWAVNKGRGTARTTSAFWLYVGSQVVFLAFFGGVFTMKMAVLLEQTLMVAMIATIATTAPTGFARDPTAA